MGKSILLYKDKAGNKLFKRTIKTRGTIQLSAKNRQGKLVTGKDVRVIIGRAKRAGKFKL